MNLPEFDMGGPKKGLLDEAIDDEKAASAPPKRQFVPREIFFAFDYPSPDDPDDVTAYKVLSRVLDGDDQTLVDRYTARFAGGPWEHLPYSARARCSDLALLKVQLRDMPKELWEAVQVDTNLRTQLAWRCAGHNARRFRGTVGEGGAAPEQPVLAIREVHPAAGAPVDG